MTKPIRAAIYTRISLDRHDEAGVERQEDLCRRLAAAHGAEIIDVFTDNSISAYAGERRPAYENLKAAIANGSVDRVYAYASDRLARRVRDLIDYLDLCAPHGTVTHTVTGETLDPASSSGRFLTTIMGAVAEQESAIKAERVRAARRQSAERGDRRTHRRTFGFTAEMGHVEEEAQAIRDGIDSVLAGESLSAIARDWSARGLTTVTGLDHSRTSVREILLKPSIAGLSSYLPTRQDGSKLRRDRSILGPGQWNAIVDEPTWTRAVAILSSPARRAPGAGGGEIKHFLAGLLVCTCGDTMYRRTRRSLREGAPRRAFYSCRRSHPGRQHATIGDEIEGYIAEVIIARLTRDDALAVLAEAMDGGDGVADAIAERTALMARREELEGEMIRGALPVSTFTRVSARIDADLAELERRIASAATGPSPAVVSALQAPDIRAWWASASPAQQRDLTAALIERIDIGPGRPGAKSFDPSRVQITWRVD
ncbi:recombinase family protein [Corynebacterium xerosis]|uniref:Recombinase family protein n=1 Tax=Corynebacterium xerosis TaxID=1725 RepID=A0ABV3UW64_9CORY